MRTPAELQDLIHEVVPELPAPALELLEELSAIGEEAELAQELAHTVALLRRHTPEPALSGDFTDKLMAALPPGPPPGASAEGVAPVPAQPTAGVSARSPWAGFAASFLIGIGLGAAWTWSPPAELGVQAPVEVAPAAPEPAEAAPGEDPATEPLPAGETPGEEGPAESPGLGPGIVEAGQAEPQPSPVEAAPIDPALVRLATEGDPVQSYVARASIVLEALERLDPEDPRVSRALALHLERTELLEQGERLLVAIQYDPAGNRIRPLIRGAQVVLRKVRHVPAPSEPAASPGASLSAIRQEVRHTGLLAACRDLLATEAPTDQAPEEAGETRDL